MIHGMDGFYVRHFGFGFKYAQLVSVYLCFLSLNIKVIVV